MGAIASRIAYDKVNESLATLKGPKFIEYREAWRSAGPEHIPEFPVHIDFELVDSCNQSCTFCPRNATTHPDLPYELDSKQKLDEAMVDRIAAQAAAHGLYSINVAWGEPLLYREVFGVIKKFHKAGVIDSRLVTNGLLLHKYTDQIFESGLVNLYVSLDAFKEETYTKQRGPGYRNVVRNLLIFLEEKKKRKAVLPVVRVSLIETTENAQEVEAFKDFWGDKVDIIDIQILTDFAKSEYENIRRKKWNCIEPFRRISIMGNGEILPCCSFHGKNLVIGNIKDMTIKQAWDSEKMKTIRSNLLQDKIPTCLVCQGC